MHTIGTYLDKTTNLISITHWVIDNKEGERIKESVLEEPSPYTNRDLFMCINYNYT
jgi:hypothetical protein